MFIRKKLYQVVRINEGKHKCVANNDSGGKTVVTIITFIDT